MMIFGWNFEIEERCKGVHCVDIGESFPTSIYLQNLASIQPRTSPKKFESSSYWEFELKLQNFEPLICSPVYVWCTTDVQPMYIVCSTCRSHSAKKTHILFCCKPYYKEPRGREGLAAHVVHEAHARVAELPRQLRRHSVEEDEFELRVARGQSGKHLQAIFSAKFWNILAGSFSAVSKRNFARKYAFDIIFQVLEALHTFAPLQSRNLTRVDLKNKRFFCKISV